MNFRSVIISSGHGQHVRGASGVLDEVDEARLVVEEVAHILDKQGVAVRTFHDNVSTTQDANLHAIVNFHNKYTRELDISVHFNAHHQTDDPMGCEVLYLTQEGLARNVSAAIASCGFKDRGPKKRTDLYFLNQTDMPAILIETCFVDSTHDAEVYNAKFKDICDAIASMISGEETTTAPPVDEETPRIDITVKGKVLLYVNGIEVDF